MPLYSEQPEIKATPLPRRYLRLVLDAIAHLERHMGMASHFTTRDRILRNATTYAPGGPTSFRQEWNETLVAFVDEPLQGNFDVTQHPVRAGAGRSAKWILLFPWGLEHAARKGGHLHVGYSLVAGVGANAGLCRADTDRLVRQFGLPLPPRPPDAEETGCIRYVGAPERRAGPSWQGGRQDPARVRVNALNRRGVPPSEPW